MQLRPVIQFAAPKYPTREEFGAEPQQLFEHLPPRWRKVKGLLGAAVVAVSAHLGGCSAPVAKSESQLVEAGQPPLLVQAAAQWTKTIFQPEVPFMGALIIEQPQVHVENGGEILLQGTPRGEGN
jgi:hypothetical protein